MADFIRARNDEQKAQNMEEIKKATDLLFCTTPYHCITLTTIAEKLNWTRAKLYKYVATKEEIFLELSADKRKSYFSAMLAAFPPESGYCPEVLSEVWAGILYCHRDYLRYCEILMSIIETNVSVNRLAEFKKAYYEDYDQMVGRFSANLKLCRERVDQLMDAVQYYSVGLASCCTDNPLVREAMELAGIEVRQRDFKKAMKNFILMCLKSNCCG